MIKSPRDVIVRPIVSEKSYAGIEHNTYTFLVDPRANKTEIKEAVQSIWDVRVTSVNTLTATVCAGGGASRARASSRLEGLSAREVYRRLMDAIDEALRNVVAVGADPGTGAGTSSSTAGAATRRLSRSTPSPVRADTGTNSSKSP